jgi:hypothetical protein
MNIGIFFLGLCWAFFIWFGLARTFSDIWPFGVILFLITGALAISRYKLKKK